MTISFRILKSYELIAVTISGPMRAEDLRNVAIGLRKDPDFVWSHNRIIFLKQDADFSDMNLETFRTAKEAMKEEFFGQLKLAPRRDKWKPRGFVSREHLSSVPFGMGRRTVDGRDGDTCAWLGGDAAVAIA